jgi:hypothetical protein
MSKHLDIADEIKVRLDESFADTPLEGVTVVVDRQKDILTEITKNVAKVTGCVVTVLWTGFSRTATGERRGNYMLRVYSRPILLAGNLPADDLVEKIDEVLNEWIPASSSPNQHCHYKMVGEGADMAPDKNFLLYEMPFNVKI